MIIRHYFPHVQASRGAVVSEHAALAALWGPQVNAGSSSSAGGAQGTAAASPAGDPTYNAFTRLGRRVQAVAAAQVLRVAHVAACVACHTAAGRMLSSESGTDGRFCEMSRLGDVDVTGRQNMPYHSTDMSMFWLSEDDIIAVGQSTSSVHVLEIISLDPSTRSAHISASCLACVLRRRQLPRPAWRPQPTRL